MNIFAIIILEALNSFDQSKNNYSHDLSNYCAMPIISCLFIHDFEVALHQDSQTFPS